MPEIRYLKVFKGLPKYNNPDELDGLSGIETIRAVKYPHTEKGLVVVALVRLEPNFSGEWRIRIPDTSNDYWEALIKNPKPNESVWLALKYGEVDVTFDKPGEYIVDLSLNGKPIHTTALILRPE